MNSETPIVQKEEVLRANTSTQAFKKEWDYPTLKLVGYEGGTIEWKNTWNQLSYRLTITVLPHQLHLGCNCVLKKDRLCLHAYKAIWRLMLDARPCNPRSFKTKMVYNDRH